VKKVANVVTRGGSVVTEGVDSLGLKYPGTLALLELRPFGYLPIWSGAYGGHTDTNLNIAVTVSDQSGNQVEAFNFGMDGCKDSTKPYANNFSFARGYAPVGTQDGNYNTHPQNLSTFHPSQTSPGGLWMGLSNTEVKTLRGLPLNREGCGRSLEFLPPAASSAPSPSQVFRHVKGRP